MRRFNLDGPTTTGAANVKSIIDSLLSGPASEGKLMRFFAHSTTPTLFEEVFRYAHAQAAGRLWVPTLREFAEYREVVARTVIGNGNGERQHAGAYPWTRAACRRPAAGGT
ncbi:MAG: hypothetical protein WKG07_32665 [Hymenobacter sp.]